MDFQIWFDIAAGIIGVLFTVLTTIMILVFKSLQQSMVKIGDKLDKLSNTVFGNYVTRSDCHTTKDLVFRKLDDKVDKA